MPISNTRKLQVFDAGMKGFSLVELSVSIVIISFLTAAILKGQNLVNEAKLQAIVSEVSTYQVAVNSFYAKYGQYPGDFSIATGTTGEWGAGVSYGDNNGQIEFKNTASTPVYEGYRLWQHLSYAGMVTSPYLGTLTTSAATIGTDVPASKSGGGYLFDYSSLATAYNGATSGAYGMLGKNVMVLGAPRATSASPISVGAVLTPNQAMSIDVKMDDSVPTSGNVRGADGVGTTAGNCVTSSLYKISLSGKNCIMIFKAANQ